MLEVTRHRIIYGIIIDGIVRDVGHTHMNLNPCGEGVKTRSGVHIYDFNTWWRWDRAGRPEQKGRDKTIAKHGYYDFMVAHLTAKQLDKWTRKNCPEIVFKEIESGDWTGHQSGEHEDKWIKYHKATTLNVHPGGNKSGRKRKYTGNHDIFGNVAWCKTKKVFIAQWTPEGNGKPKYIKGSSSTNIKFTYQCLINKYNKVKDQECYEDCKPKSLEEYIEHLCSKYGFWFDCNYDLIV